MVKILSWNIHGFYSKNLEDQTEYILNQIRNTNADIVNIQELILKGNYEKSKAELNHIHNEFMDMGYKYIFYYTNNMNVILSKIKFIASELKYTYSKNVPRSAAICSFLGFTFIGTHLDVYDNTGKIRILQIKELLTSLHFNNPIILAGDFNSLRRNDYSDYHWNSIVEADMKRKVITNEDIIPFIENFGFIDSFILSNTNTPSVTCAFNRRVDYVYMYKYFYNVKSKVIENNLSDHYSLVVDFDLVNT